ncbi:MAG TPA: OsmC family protein [Solirubrobacteraceae bacterium]|nr:OsmC family protein [Solirubrobacteraceae bacterium]
MHNVNVAALEQTVARAAEDPASVLQPVAFDGEWQTAEGAPQFRTSFPLPGGRDVIFEADFPPPMGGTGSAPNPLAYCFWGGLACYAMTYAQEAAREGVELRALRARVEAQVDMTRALGVSDNPPVERIDWYLDVDADVEPERLDAIKAIADDRCPGVFCIRNPIDLHTHLEAGVTAR